MSEQIKAPKAAPEMVVIGYINEQTARILASGMTVCTHISHVKTEYAQVALSAEVKS
ncbi:hypothetical protein LMG19089_02927 [Ralstonia edaphis]|uniref:hypothetical protein n=1 Tax=Ralstonia edaphi TaxID=3058599 RepID=UPI0028F50E5F|nr:hypothetical protein [Ralstonia sp. LMG 6871]CAJ0701791.1 hypothetical protein LMG19089_02927 [Ralstonia sp. LMG 6871]